MKKVMMTISLLSAFMAFGEYSKKFVAAMHDGADTAVSIKVCDETGNLVTNASVCVCYNVGANRSEECGRTGEGGVFLFSKKTNGYGEIYVKKDGYYDSTGRFSFIDMGREHDAIDGVWQPNPMHCRVVLKRIRNPVVSCNMKDLVVPATNTWIGFDAAQYDWTSPFGKGTTADFAVSLEWDGKMQWQYTDMRLRIDFIGKNAYFADVDNDSACPYVYEAQTNTFDISELSYYRVGRKPRVKYEFDKGKELIVRSRCQTNIVSGVVSYNYLAIANIEFAVDNNGRPILWMPCYFNPTPNDTNLEPRR